MFMRYFGGGVGHSETQIQFSHENDAMNVDQEVEIEEEAESVEDECLLENLHRIASTFIEGEMDDDRDEVEEPIDCGSDEADDKGGGTDDGALSEDGEPPEDDFGPEDGEDEGYVDTGYGTL